jgi:hypothetical protein
MDAQTNHSAEVDLIDALQSTAMLCALRTRSLGLTRTHKAASTEVAKNHKASANAASVKVNRLADADTYHRKIVQLQGEVRRAYETYTLPWDQNGGWRLLPNQNFELLARATAPLRAEIKKTLEEYSAHAPEIINKARENLGDLANDIELPTVEELCSAYEARLEFQSIPDTKALKNLPPAIVGHLEKHMTNRAAVAYETAMEDLQERMVKPLQHLIQRLDAFDERENRGPSTTGRDLQGVFRDTTVTNITDLAKTLPTLNILASQETQAHISQVVGLASEITPESLRASKEKRDSARAKAAAILAGMGFGAGS